MPNTGLERLARARKVIIIMKASVGAFVQMHLSAIKPIKPICPMESRDNAVSAIERATFIASIIDFNEQTPTDACLLCLQSHSAANGSL